MRIALKNHYSISSFLSLIVILLMTGGCGHPADNDQLVTVDSLLAQNRGKEAMQMLQMLNTSSFNHHNKAYMTLLTTQADLAINHAIESDNDINEAARYFQTHGDKEKYARALLYQGCVNKQLPAAVAVLLLVNLIKPLPTCAAPRTLPTTMTSRIARCPR